jgi:hypothetical protein
VNAEVDGESHPIDIPGMEPPVATLVVAEDAPAVAGLVAAVESSLYRRSGFSQVDLEEEWADIDPEQNACVVRDGDRIVGLGDRP